MGSLIPRPCSVGTRLYQRLLWVPLGSWELTSLEATPEATVTREIALEM